MQYSCQNGYVLRGNAERECNEEKRWMGLERYCEPFDNIGNNYVGSIGRILLFPPKCFNYPSPVIVVLY